MREIRWRKRWTTDERSLIDHLIGGKISTNENSLALTERNIDYLLFIFKENDD